MLTCPPGARPNSGAEDEVSTRNSCMASTDTKLLVPPIALRACNCPVPLLPIVSVGETPKLADTPSTKKVFASALCPEILNWPGDKPDVGAMTTPGVSCSSVLKLRPFNGKLSTKL